MKGIVDIHNHIMYGVDDGSDSFETSISMIDQEYSQGVRDIILTPHCNEAQFMPKPEVVKRRYKRIRDMAEKKYDDLHIHLGSEIMAFSGTLLMLEEHFARTLADTVYVLIEFYPNVSLREFEARISQIMNNGYVPVLAHCERYGCLRKGILGSPDMDEINHLYEMGVLLQVNATSVFRDDKRFVKKLIEANRLTFIATDAHSLHRRSVHFNECIEYMRKFCDDRYIKKILIDNPRKLLNNDYI